MTGSSESGRNAWKGTTSGSSSLSRSRTRSSSGSAHVPPWTKASYPAVVARGADWLGGEQDPCPRRSDHELALELGALEGRHPLHVARPHWEQLGHGHAGFLGVVIDRLQQVAAGDRFVAVRTR